MKLLKIKLKNFASYKELEFDYSDKGLTLIQGDTGAGKSTLQDAAMWVLFGKTAKNGSANDIRSWNTNDFTLGVLNVEVRGKTATIYRTRGKNNENDLYWAVDGNTTRGKDLKETQILLNDFLGISEDLYIIGAYFNEFSLTGQFFNAKAKDRRELFESLADLSLPLMIAERASSEKRKAEKVLTEILSRNNKISGRFEQLKRTKENTQRDAQKWSQDQERHKEEQQSKIEATAKLLEDFEIKRHSSIQEWKEKHAKALVSKCPTCGNNKENESLYRKLISGEETSVNPYKKIIENLKSYQPSSVNPFTSSLLNIESELKNLDSEIESIERSRKDLQHRYDSLEMLQDLSSQLRCELLRKAIKQVEHSTNRYLNTYFDGELKVEFILTDSDDLDITIWKSGNECVYKQLSKGQRGLLKLCFSVSVMNACSASAGVHFNSLFFDESLDGLDNNLKIKAFGLFSELEKDHESIFVIEHNTELKSLFSTSYHVSMIGDSSFIEEI